MHVRGERVEDVTTHPAFRNGVRTLAGLLDMQHDPKLRDEMTYTSPTTGDRVGPILHHSPRPGKTWTAAAP